MLFRSAMAWMNIVYGFAGLRSDGEQLKLAPRLPERWKRLTFSIVYLGRVIRICMEGNKTSFRLEQGEPLALLIYDQPFTLTEDELIVLRA